MANDPKIRNGSQLYSWKGYDSYRPNPRPQSERAPASRHSLSTAISPPALKRKRVASGLFDDSWERPSSIGTPLPTDPDRGSARPQLRRSESYGNRKVWRAEYENSLEPLRRSSSFLGSTTHHGSIGRDSSLSVRGSDGTHSGSSSRRSSFSKQACPICKNISGTNYDPMITCLGCDRLYHDSCRKPPLIDGVDPQRWRCFICLSGPERRVSKAKKSRAMNGPLRSLSANEIAPKDVSLSVSQAAHSIPSPRPPVSAPITFNPRPIEEKVSSTVRCTDCRQRCNFPENGTKDVKCRECQNRTSFIGNSNSNIPETPDLGRKPSGAFSSLSSTKVSLFSTKVPSTRAIKSAPTSKRPGPLRSVSSLKLTKPAVPSPPKVDKEAEANFMPFERTVVRKPQKLELDNLKRVGNFYEVLSRNHQSLIETMTDAEKAAKIAEIKGRGSRKTFFGRDHKLAHVRRYQRHDIHDERDGMWKPASGTLGSNKSDCAMKDRDEPETLREAFGLPENVVPINDGQTELAFRTGALTNGRLPRSRVIYKVGKLFGGELTVRTS